MFSEGRGLVLLWLRGPLCHTAYQGSPKSQGLMVSMSPQSSSPALAYCHSCFLISQTQSSVTQTVYLACLPQPGREKEGEKKPGSRHKIILHNTREFKEALPISPRTPPPPLFALMKKTRGDKEKKKGGKHIRRKLLNSPLSLIWDC